MNETLFRGHCPGAGAPSANKAEHPWASASESEVLETTKKYLTHQSGIKRLC